MKILLISPYPNAKKKLLYKFIFQSTLVLEQVAATIPEEYEVSILDEKYHKICFDNDFDLIGISCLTSNAIRGYKIADEFRSKGKKVVLGGYHPTILPEEAKQHADAVVIGEAETIMPYLLKDFENGSLKPYYKAEKHIDPSLIPPAKRFDQDTPKLVSIQTSRGCPNRCKFCSMHKIEGTIFRSRPIKNVIDELKSIKCQNLYIVDSSMTNNPSYSKSLFKEMKGLNKHFECYANINVVGKDDEFLKLASEAGCYRFFIGFESFSQETIDSLGKKTNKVKEYAKAISKIHDYGILITGSFIFGFDTDTPRVFDDTLKASLKLNLDTAAFDILSPYPGTECFTNFDSEGRILTKDWNKYNEGNVVFKPKNMTKEELLNGIIGVINKYYSLKNISKRWLFESKYLDNHFFFEKFSRNIFAKLFYKELFEM